MKKASFIILSLILTGVFIFLYGKVNASSVRMNSSPSKTLVVGEDLLYEVSYSFIKLGQVRLIITAEKNVDGKKIYSARAYINSYSGIPFVDLHQIYESRFDSACASRFFRGLILEDNDTTYTDYNFDYKKSRIHVLKGRIHPPKVWTDSTTSLDKNYVDGLSIFYYARTNFGKKKSVNVPCFVTEKKESAKINFYTEVTDESIDAVDYDIACVRLDGETDFVSVFGLTGYFEGWFTNDEASIPVIAKMKVIIGNITLELKEWKRNGWMPPRYKN
ncbi:MAG: DUF3108 domain-containing protein [Ignavibacteriaceae bacterium]|nr:DUF3108 domain-containing protein [Ignavibacteriaceae bacterium]